MTLSQKIRSIKIAFPDNGRKDAIEELALEAEKLENNSYIKESDKTYKQKFIEDVFYSIRYLINDDLTVNSTYKESGNHVQGFNNAIRKAAYHYNEMEKTKGHRRAKQKPRA